MTETNPVALHVFPHHEQSFVANIDIEGFNNTRVLESVTSVNISKTGIPYR